MSVIIYQSTSETINKIKKKKTIILSLRLESHDNETLKYYIYIPFHMDLMTLNLGISTI